MTTNSKNSSSKAPVYNEKDFFKDNGLKKCLNYYVREFKSHAKKEINTPDELYNFFRRKNECLDALYGVRMLLVFENRDSETKNVDVAIQKIIDITEKATSSFN